MEKILYIGLGLLFLLAVIDIIARRKQKHVVSVDQNTINAFKGQTPTSSSTVISASPPPAPIVTEKIIYKASFGSHTCTHGEYGGPKMLTIKGKRIGIGASPFCEACTVEYFNKHSTTCDKCGDLICPTMPVGQHYANQADGTEKFLTVCQKMSCALPGDLVGTWGEGKVLPMPWGSGTPVHEPKTVPPEIVEAIKPMDPQEALKELDEPENEEYNKQALQQELEEIADEDDIDVASELGKSKGAEILMGSTTFGSAYSEQTPEASAF
jgi:hypothetical protein